MNGKAHALFGMFTVAGAALLAGTLGACAERPVYYVGADGGVSTGTPALTQLPGVPAGSLTPPAVNAVVPPPIAGVNCAFETHSTIRVDGRLIETFTANGQLYNFELNGVPWNGNGASLTTVAHYAAGPCAGAGAACRFDTRAFVNVDGQVLEYITAYGRNWTFDDGVPTDSGSDLATSARYYEACGGRQPCTFDTRTFVVQDNRIVESITAYGRIFEITIGSYGGNNEYPTARNGQDLTSFPHYANGPCRGRGAGQCVFDGRTYLEVNGQVVEVVSAYGSVWRFNSAGMTAEPNGALLNTQSPWNRGVCR